MRETFSTSRHAHAAPDSGRAPRDPGRPPRWSPRRVPFCLVAAAAVALSLGMASCNDHGGDGQVLVTVNGTPITYGELRQELKKRYGPAALLDLVDDALIREEADRLGLSVTPQELEVGLERAAARVGSMADLNDRLERAGIPLEAYQRKVETDLLLDRIIAHEVEVSDAEIAAYYEANRDQFLRGPRVRARLILLFGDRSNAVAVREALNDPEADFAGLASSLSEDEATRESGGDMGYFEENDYAPAISEVAFSLEPGQISDIIPAPDGWVILKVEDKKPAGVLGMEEVREQLRRRVARHKQEERHSTWLIEARRQARLRISDRNLREAVEASLDIPPMPPLPGEL